MRHLFPLFEQLGFIYFLPLLVLSYHLDGILLEGMVFSIVPEHSWAPNTQICHHCRGGYQSNTVNRSPDIFVSILIVGNNSKTYYSFSCEEKQPFWAQLNLSLVIMRISASGTSSGTTVSFGQNHNCQRFGRLTFLNLIIYTRWFSYLPKEGAQNTPKPSRSIKPWSIYTKHFIGPQIVNGYILLVLGSFFSAYIWGLESQASPLLRD